ncbi:hypothetical protein H8D30_00130 [bacterium]|nr:hypothetical protein [bacterium]
MQRTRNLFNATHLSPRSSAGVRSWRGGVLSVRTGKPPVDREAKKDVLRMLKKGVGYPLELPL